MKAKKKIDPFNARYDDIENQHMAGEQTQRLRDEYYAKNKSPSHKSIKNSQSQKGGMKISMSQFANRMSNMNIESQK